MMLEEVTLITTTINDPANLEKFVEEAVAANVALKIVVAGDENTPHAYVRNRLRRCLDLGAADTTYLSPRHQRVWKCSELIGWRTIQRRNIATLEAVRAGAEVILTVDDDNYPMTGYFEQLRGVFHEHVDHIVHTSDGWYNPGRHCLPSVIHRGFPLSQWHQEFTLSWETRHKQRIGVVAGLWYGEPDVDALSRIATPTTVTHMDRIALMGFVVGPDCISPFNTQNTAFISALAPALHCFTGVGRHDDIVGSYLTKLVADRCEFSIHYGPPFVTQERNTHNLVRDLEQETWGYANIEQCVTDFKNALNATAPGTNMPRISIITWLERMVNYMLDGGEPVLPRRSLECYAAYLEDMKEAMK